MARRKGLHKGRTVAKAKKRTVRRTYINGLVFGVARKRGRKAYKLIKWHSHHEPRNRYGKPINVPLKFWRQQVEAGAGWDYMLKKYGWEEAAMAVGIFSLLQKRTANQPRELRGWVLDNNNGRPVSVAQLFSALCMPDGTAILPNEEDVARLSRVLTMLVRAKWLAYLNFDDARNHTCAPPAPGVRHTPIPIPIPIVTRNKEQAPPQRGGNGKNCQQELSVSDFGSLPRGAIAQKIRRLLRVTPAEVAKDHQARKQCEGDLTNILRVVEHAEGSSPEDRQRLVTIVCDVATDDSIETPIKVLNTRLRKEGLHYVR